MIKKIRLSKNISYTDIVSTKFSFQDSFSADTINSNVTFVASEKQTHGYFKLISTNERYFFDGNKAVQLHLSDSTYKVDNEALKDQNTRTILYWEKLITNNLKKPGRIRQFADTMIDHKAYGHVRLTTFDTVQNNQHCYTIEEFIVNKTTYLPLYIKTQIRGFAGDGSLGGLIEFHSYHNFKLDENHFPDLSSITIPDHFKLPVKKKATPFLVNGTKAPAIKLFSIDGEEKGLQALSGKPVLINFTLIGCLHCVAAVEMLNMLDDKYKGKINIINVYPVDGWKEIDKFNKKMSTLGMSYRVDSNIQNMYPYEGYPSFYLLDENGFIAQTYNGYFKELPQQLSSKINTLINN